MNSKIEEVINEIVDNWMKIDGVNGIAQSKKDNVDYILVTVDFLTPKIKKLIPKQYKGFEVQIMEIGSVFVEDSDV